MQENMTEQVNNIGQENIPQPLKEDQPQDITQNRNQFKYLFIGVLVALVFIISGVTLFFLQKKADLARSNNFEKIEEEVAEIDEADIKDQNISELSDKNVYKINANRGFKLYEAKDNIFNFLEIEKELSSEEGLESTVNYEPESSNSDKEYYLVTSLIIEEKNYKKGSTTIAVTRESNSLIPYLSDSKYCEDDNDCQIRSSYCTHGAYNKFDSALGPLGCGLPNFEGFEEHPESYMKCSYEVNYDGAKCENKQCIVINPTAVCPSGSDNEISKETENIQQLAYIKLIKPAYDIYDIELDFIEWIDDSSAPNGFIIENSSEEVETFAIGIDTPITMQTFSNDSSGNFNFNEVISFNDFVKAFEKDNSIGQRVYVIEIKSETVISVKERYTP
jgi:hypothetical protein